MDKLIYLVPVMGLIGLLYTFVKFNWVSKQDAGTDRMKEISKYAGPGIPCLVLVDRQGKVVADSYVNGQYRGPSAVMNEMGQLAAKKVAAK